MSKPIFPGCSARFVGPHRYRLDRLVAGRDNGRLVTFIMLNPSTADAHQDDPTIRRCIGFARSWDCARLIVVNVFAWRATHPKDLWAARAAGNDIVGPENDAEIVGACAGSAYVVAAWGAHIARDRGRAAHVIGLVTRNGPLWCLGRSLDGHPRHPLMLRGGTSLELLAGAAA